MNNNRYDKINALMHLQNQKAHYRRILEAKKNINFSHNDSQATTIHLSKVEKEKERERRENNIKLVNKIREIQGSNGLLQSMNLKAKEKDKQRRLKSHHSHNKFAEQQILKENEKMVKRIVGAKASVGTKNEWKLHFKNYRNMEKNIRKYSLHKTYDPESHLKETLSDLNRKGIEHNTLERLSSLGKHREKGELQIKGLASHQSRGSKQTTIKQKKSRMKRRRRSNKSSDFQNESSQQKIPSTLVDDPERLKVEINSIILNEQRSHKNKTEILNIKNEEKLSQQ